MRSVYSFLLLFVLLLGCGSKNYTEATDRAMVAAILENLDSHTLDIDAKMSVYSKDIIHMGPGNRPITSLDSLRTMLLEERKWGHSEMKHEAYEIHSYADHVIARGGVRGTWYAKDGRTSLPFATNNLITFKRSPDGQLKIWHVIFNRIED